MVAVPELREIISRFSTLEARVAALENGTRKPTRDPPAPPRVEIEQWTVRLSKALIERLKAEAAADKPPSHLLGELGLAAANLPKPTVTKNPHANVWDMLL
jgi:hypothetical protein